MTIAPSLLQIRNLSIHFKSSPILRAFSLDIPQNSTLGLVGESGSGKTMTALSVMGLLSLKFPHAEIKGEIIYGNRNLRALSSEECRQLRRRQMSMIFQNPFTYFDPSYRIRRQFEEMKSGQNSENIFSILEHVQIQDAERILNSYPHELSGGQLQRLMIGLAILNHPEFLIADEPTTALDPSIKWDILSLLEKIKKERGLTLLLISHDLPSVTEFSDFIAVLYRGILVEYSDKASFVRNPLHPYSQSLLSQQPKPPVEELDSMRQGCIYAGQCPLAKPVCTEKDPPYFQLETEKRVKCWLYEN